MVNYQEAFEKPFSDIKKLLIGILLSIVPIISFFAKGFILESSGAGKTKPGKKMPEWRSFGKLFLKGLAMFAITIIYFIPAVVVFIFGAGTAILNVLSAIPIEEITEAGTEKAMNDVILPAIQAALPSLTTIIPMIVLSLVLALLSSYIIPMAAISYLKDNNFASSLKLKRIFKKSFTGKYFVVWIVMVLVSMILTSLLNIIPIVGLPAASFIAGIISYSLFGQVYLETEKTKK